MNNQNNTITKLAETALLAALCYVAFTFLQIKIPVPGGDATSEMHFVFWERFFWADGMEDLPGPLA